MTQDPLIQWLTSRNLGWMLNRLLLGPRERRRRVLLACAFCRRVWDLLETPAGGRARQVVEGAERWADGVLDAASVHRLARTARPYQEQHDLGEGPVLLRPTRRRRPPRGRARTPDDWAVRAAVSVFGHADDTPERVAWLARQAVRASRGVGRDIHVPRDEARAAPADATDEVERQCDLIRDIMCPPLGRDLGPAEHWLRWGEGTVPRMARAITLERRWQDLRILRDALIEAGCCDEAYYEHCLSPGPHVPGCWLLDLLTNDMGLG
jgi:hypothetical protein